MRILVVVAVVSVCVGCGPTMKPQVCVPGKSEACVGPGGCAGGQRCNAEGTALGDCDCGTVGGGTGGGDGGAIGGGGGVLGGGAGGGGGSLGGGAGGGGGGGSDAGLEDAGVDAGTDAGVDAGVDAGPPACDPTPTDGGSPGCQTGQRCTWVTLTATPTGVTTCVPDGTVALGGACTQGTPGLTTGYDNCAAGGICISGTCARACSLNDPNSCGTDHCVSYSGLFANPPEAPATGACVPACDPLTSTPCTSGQGCYLLVSSTTTISVCAGAGTVMAGQPITGAVYANSCVPGAKPRRVFGTANFECGGLCAPAEVTMGVNVASEGGVAPNSCQARWGAAAPSDATAGESCRYFWAQEPFDALSPFSNTLGFCFKHAAALYDSNGDMTPDAPFPRCTTLTTGDMVPPIENPPGNDALYFWCAPKPAMKRKQAVERHEVPTLQRLTNWR